VGKPADRQHAPAGGELVREHAALGDLAARRSAIRRLGARMGRHDVPEQHLVAQAELGEDAVDDRGRRLRRARARQLPLGGERDARDAGAAIAGRLADEEERRRRVLLQVRAQPTAADVRAVALAVEVEGLADRGVGEAVDERARRG
jgi:hypothetical protein